MYVHTITKIERITYNRYEKLFDLTQTYNLKETVINSTFSVKIEGPPFTLSASASDSVWFFSFRLKQNIFLIPEFQKRTSRIVPTSWTGLLKWPDLRFDILKQAEITLFAHKLSGLFNRFRKLLDPRITFFHYIQHLSKPQSLLWCWHTCKRLQHTPGLQKNVAKNSDFAAEWAIRSCCSQWGSSTMFTYIYNHDHVHSWNWWTARGRRPTPGRPIKIAKAWQRRGKPLESSITVAEISQSKKFATQVTDGLTLMLE